MIISRTPLRISFAGGGTDLPGFYKEHAPNGYGAVISATINWYIYITVNKKFDDLIRVSYSKTEIVDHVDKLEHNVIREALKLVGIEKGIEVVYMADIPLVAEGSGLGSSSSLAVGVLKALYAYKGQHVSAEKLAYEACQIEIEILKHPIGKQDQYAAAYGGFNYIQFNQDESVFIEPLVWPKAAREKLSSRLMLFNTAIPRISSTILSDQSGLINKRLKHYKILLDLVGKAKKIFHDRECVSIGKLLHEGWECKSQLSSKISTSSINEWYLKAREAGAIGGKVVGAGGGGFLMLYCDEDKQENVCKALSNLRYSPIAFEPQGSKIIYYSD